MSLGTVHEGEDVPVVVEFDGGATDPDDTGTDGIPDASITITYDVDGTVVVNAAAMTHESVGTFEYVWDTAADTTGTGSYVVEVTAEFGGETKIVKDRIGVR